MKKLKVYDWPTRVFHWLFAAGFLVAFIIGKTVDDDSAGFAYHMLLGLTVGAVVVLRVIWGLVGSRYARFSSFELSPGKVVGYFKGVVANSTPRYAGHNPASSWLAIIMMVLALGLASSGYLMASGTGGDVLEEVHELMANAFILLVIGHLAGMVLHMFKHRDLIVLSMVNGEKDPVEGAEPIQSTHRFAAFVMFIIVTGFFFVLNQNYDAKAQTLNLFGSTLNLGEEHEHGGEKQGGGDHDHDDHDDDDDHQH